MKRFFMFFWENRTRTFGFVQGLVAILAGMADIFTKDTLKWFLIANAVLTYALGQFNSWQSKNSPPPDAG